MLSEQDQATYHDPIGGKEHPTDDAGYIDMKKYHNDTLRLKQPSNKRRRTDGN